MTLRVHLAQEYGVCRVSIVRIRVMVLGRYLPLRYLDTFMVLGVFYSKV